MMILRQYSKNMVKSRQHRLVRNLFLIGLFVGFVCSGCAPTYPKDKLTETLINVCKKEYEVEIQAKLIGKTIIVFIPLDELFDLKLDISPEAVEKIEDVILTTSRALFSTDAEVDFYMIIAADVKTTAAEVFLVRYMDDVYKFMHGWINREDYSSRILWQINFNPKLLKDSFFDFDVEEITLPGFLAAQIAQRLNKIFASSVVHKMKINSEFDPQTQRFFFSVVSADNTRFQKVYLPIIANIADKVLQEYKFEDFSEIIIRNELLRNFVVITKNDREEYRKVDIDALLTLPFYN
ncbi:MAG: hypothetical protein ABIC39_02905 [Pseudomonadota bacterium]